MAKITKMLVILTVFLGVFTMDVAGARSLKSKEEVDHPQTIFGGLPSPGFSGSFPSPGFSGSFPSPSFSGSFPSPGLSGSFPSPGFGFGPSSFCSFPGVRCAPVQPSIPNVPHGAAAGGNGSP